MKVKFIYLDRSDPVARSVSAYIASNRGIWHADDKAATDKIEQSSTASFSFDKLLTRYLLGLQQSNFLTSLKEIFPPDLELDYEVHLKDFSASKLLNTLIENKVDRPRSAISYSPTLRKLRNEENEEIEKKFKAKLADFLS